ncbi:MAG: type II toxin-antitoxin system RelB/DinJ family antitoxin [Clostridiales bacterium]|jgi:addiction module RelB/DinJ family antitoxin|nr:type II toxin-antitoxin system RelB/DinJ family antitoxin [Clostridiales bacterium]
MNKNETLHIRVNDAVKSSAEKTLEMLGLSISEAVNMLLYQIAIDGGLPFSVSLPVAPDNVTVRSNEEMYEKLNIGAQQIHEGKVIDADIVIARLKNEYGF